MNFDEWKAAIQDPAKRSEALDVLPEDGHDEEVVNILREVLCSPEWLDRTSAAELLGNCHTESARVALRKSIAQEKNEVALGYMICSLGMIGNPIDYTLLISKLSEENISPRMKIDLAEALLHLAVNNSVSTISAEYQRSTSEQDTVGIPALLRIVECMNEAFAHIEKQVLSRRDKATTGIEKGGIEDILKAVRERPSKNDKKEVGY
jgi:hypothetical protein